MAYIFELSICRPDYRGALNTKTHQSVHNVTELRQKRAALSGEVRKIQEAASGGILSAEDLGKCDKIESDLITLEKNISLAERQEKREKELNTVAENRVSGATEEDNKEKGVKEKRAAFNKFLSHGANSLNSVESRDLAADVAGSGGNIVAPQQFVSELLIDLRNMVFLREKARIFQLGAAATLGIPQLTAEVADSDWTTEIQLVTTDSTQAIGKRTLTPTMLTKGAKISIKLLEVGTLPAETIVKDSLNYKFAVTLEKAYMTGTGTAQPLGLFTASANGISTGRDVATANTTTAITADNLFHTQMSLKAQYRKLPDCGWIFHRDAIKQVRLLKDSQNRYLFEPSLVAGQPDRLLGSAIYESEYAPNTFTTGSYVGIYGALSYYWIADQIGFSLQRLTELYAATNQVGFIGRLSTDGAPAMETAFARIKLA